MAILVIHGGAGGDGPWLGKTPLDPEESHVWARLKVLAPN